jgi:hypothetical protein
MHRNARSERSLNHRKANYDPDQFTEENSKNPSLNSTLGCLKVVDTFRHAPFGSGGGVTTDHALLTADTAQIA